MQKDCMHKPSIASPFHSCSIYRIHNQIQFTIMTLKKDMLQALEEEAFQDVTLVGTDHVDVPATKAILGIRSPVFRRMFFGGFQETDKDRVSLNYPSLVLKVLIKYCYSDELDLDMIYSDNAGFGLTDEEAILMVQLRDAANYFELPDFHISISNELGESIAQKGEILCVCAVLSELFARGETEGPMWSIMMAILEADPEKCLLPQSEWNTGILSCSLPLFCRIMTPSVDPFVAVKSIQKWSQANPEVFQPTEATEDEKVLQQIADAIKLDSISSTQLAQIKPCQVFPMERLYQAFVQHGMKQGVEGISLSPRSMPAKQVVAYIRGAGVESVNGSYLRDKGRFSKLGVYGDVSSVFELSWHEVHKKWEVKVRPHDQSSKQFVLYESSLSGENDVPFALWYCCDGKDPAPYVAIASATPVAGQCGTPVGSPANEDPQGTFAADWFAHLEQTAAFNAPQNPALSSNTRRRARR